MGHVVLGAPPIARYHLHERLLRLLRQRGHRVSLLALAPAEATFWRHQGEYLVRLPADGDRAAVAGWPFDDLAANDHNARRRPRLARAAALAAWFRAERPDLVVLDQRRDDDAALLHFAARAHGCRTLWFGDGLLPHTLQCDDRGIDGDAAFATCAPESLRVVRPDPELLAACLAHALAATPPFALPRGEVHAPPLRQRLADALATARDDGLRAAWSSLGAFAAALPPATPPPQPWRLPDTPFVAVLLQDAADARLRRDANTPPTANQLVAAAAAASHALGCAGRLAVVAATPAARGRLGGYATLPAAAAPLAAATALAVATINHPAASIGLLAGTPVVHLGRALYGVRGVARMAGGLDELAAALAAAAAREHPALRTRALTWLFAHGHVWCSGSQPDHNGVVGVAAAIEARLASSPQPALRPRCGPPWPLARAKPGSRRDPMA